MDTQYIEQLVLHLKAVGIAFDSGLTEAETAHVEQKYRFRFPPDLRQILQYALPISKDFPNWREDPEEEIRDSLEWPLEGICFDIDNNGFWLPEWGDKPESLYEAFVIAKKAVRKAPKLIPIMVHRYIPDEPNLPGNPVLSVWQTDIIHYGYDLADYFVNEYWHPDKSESRKEQKLLELARPEWSTRIPRPIRFWDEVMAWNGLGYAGNDTEFI